MEIAIISNICANMHALKAFIDYIDSHYKVEKILNAGNFLQIGPNPSEICKNLLSNKRFINILSYKDEEIINRNPTGVLYPKYYSNQDWTVSQIGLTTLNKLKKIPKRDIFEMNGKKVLLSYTFPYDITNKIDILAIGEPIKGFTGKFHDIDVISPGIFGYSSESELSFAVINAENWKMDLITIKYNNANLITDYKTSSIPDKKEVVRTFHGTQI